MCAVHLASLASPKNERGGLFLFMIPQGTQPQVFFWDFGFYINRSDSKTILDETKVVAKKCFKYIDDN